MLFRQGRSVGDGHRFVDGFGKTRLGTIETPGGRRAESYREQNKKSGVPAPERIH